MKICQDEPVHPSRLNVQPPRHGHQEDARDYPGQTATTDLKQVEPDPNAYHYTTTD